MKSNIAIACLLAGGLILPGAVFAQMAPNTQAPTTKSATAKDAVADAAITTKIKAQFATEKDVSATSIKVDTDNGVVNLSGTAKSQQEADRAGSIAQGTKGVASVTNHIQVAPK